MGSTEVVVAVAVVVAVVVAVAHWIVGVREVGEC